MNRRVPKVKSKYTLHNKVRLVRGGSLYFDLLEQLIDEAADTVHFQTYIFDNDETGSRIANALIRAAKRNVNVFLLVDAFASQHLSKKLIEEWRSANINFRWFKPILKNRYLYFGRRLHHKVVVADGYKCLVGGLNISNRYNDLPGSPAWLDWALLAEGEVALLVRDVCEKRARSRWMPWRRKSKLKFQLPVSVKEECKVGIRINDWVRGKSEITKSYAHMLRQAQSEVIIMSSYFMPGVEFRRNLRGAIKRGVRIKIILAGVSDIKLAKQSERYLYAWLLRNKIEVFEYTKNILHGKMAYCDGHWLTVGSYNLNGLSAKASVEMNLEVLDDRIAQLAGNALRKIIEQDCVHITTQHEIKTHFIERVRQKIAYNIFRFLLFIFTFYFRQQRT